MPTSVPPRARRGAAHSTPSSPASSDDDDDDEGAGPSSAFSLISPRFHQSFPGVHRKEREEDATSASSGSGFPERINKHPSAEYLKETKKRDPLPVENNLSPWEEWFLCKEKELRARLQARALEAMNQEILKMKEKQECERKKKLAEERHRQWVQKKNEEVQSAKTNFVLFTVALRSSSVPNHSQHELNSQVVRLCVIYTFQQVSPRITQGRKKRERKVSQEMAEKAARELERAQSKEKAKEMYQEWLKKKKSEEVQKKKEEREKEKQREAELQEKKEKSEKMFKEWLQSSRNKPRPAPAGYAYANGMLTGYPDGSTYPAPAFYNPIPWKPVHIPPPKEEKIPVSTQARLFGDFEDNQQT
ncbi:hypothetical protein JRQ81_000492 [Phrynocephalus forsythii]|uniref:Coiled-coil domain-containing protein n=1 Tax=Phrynocephalus forsythii TaxID=171643 RepID=A0A9Q0Y632_9SAUR|nr:hypothetical protein JRQ81_000492 [Phrynocephalus forsythii]